METRPLQANKMPINRSDMRGASKEMRHRPCMTNTDNERTTYCVEYKVIPNALRSGVPAMFHAAQNDEENLPRMPGASHMA
jgi:hypothetical protein